MQKKSNNSENYNQMAKLALIGDSSVGKTNILLRYINSQTNLNHIATIGIDFKVKIVKIDDFKLKLQLWDTAGQERFRNLTGTVYQGAQAILLVYSVTDRKTFTSLTRWIQEINSNAPSNVIIALAGNKKDLEAQRVVSYQQGKAIAIKFGNCIFFQTSAKTGSNIKELFDELTRKIKDKLVKKAKQSKVKNSSKEELSNSVKLIQKPVKLKNPSQNQKHKKKGCC